MIADEKLKAINDKITQIAVQLMKVNVELIEMDRKSSLPITVLYDSEWVKKESINQN